MKKIVRLNEDDLSRIVKRVLTEDKAEILKSTLSNMSSKKVPGSRSMRVCAVLEVSDRKDRNYILNSCTSEAWGVNCGLAIAALPLNELNNFTTCTIACARNGKMKYSVTGEIVPCNFEAAIDYSAYTIK